MIKGDTGLVTDSYLKKMVKDLSMLFNHFMIFTEVFFLIFFSWFRIRQILPFVALNLVLSLSGYVFLHKDNYSKWLFVTYFICLEIMAVGTVLLGYGSGFSLYSFSMIVVAFYLHYIEVKTGSYGARTEFERKMILPVGFSILTVIVYFICYYYVKTSGSVTCLPEAGEFVMFVYNSVTVFSLLVLFMGVYMNAIIRGESELERLALYDKLTGLHNRHYFLNFSSGLSKERLRKYWIAIIDIDNFKKVNDVYGHNCGDYVLKSVAETISEVCSRCSVCRWGGEEFIILADSGEEENTVLETLRQKIASTELHFEDSTLNVTVTTGTEKYSEGLNIDNWISLADAKLYEGKKSGKNRVVY